MAYVKTKTINGHQYRYLVESYRQGKKVKTRTLKYLGKAVDGDDPSLQQTLHTLRAARKNGRKKTQHVQMTLW